MQNEKMIPTPVLSRLPRYYRYLISLFNMGIARISSKDLAKRMGTTSSQVRQDFFSFGANGLQGYGYEVEHLLGEIGKILGIETPKKVIVIGAGSLGQALVKHADFEKKGFKVIGIFDVNAQIIGKEIRGTRILHMDSLAEFTQNNDVDIAIITIPDAQAVEVVNQVCRLGIKGIWNYAQVELKVPPGVSVENIHMIDSLMILGYKLKHEKQKLAKTSKNNN